MIGLVMLACHQKNEKSLPASSLPKAEKIADTIHQTDTTANRLTVDTGAALPVFKQRINTRKVPADSVVAFAKKWMAVKYKYASASPAEGFDCSGFISFVFNHFNIAVPRSSVDFTHQGMLVSKKDARPGDLILFTGTDPTVRIVGHMGIVVNNTDSLRFIHSSSGKANGVTITALNSYYLGRFVSVRRVFK